MFMTFDEIIEDLMLYRLDMKAISSLRKISESEIIELHKITSTSICVEYDLWNIDNPLTLKNYVPQLEHGIDVNPKHPESMSYKIIHSIWKRIK